MNAWGDGKNSARGREHEMRKGQRYPAVTATLRASGACRYRAWPSPASLPISSSFESHRAATWDHDLATSALGCCCTGGVDVFSLGTNFGFEDAREIPMTTNYKRRTAHQEQEQV